MSLPPRYDCGHELPRSAPARQRIPSNRDVRGGDGKRQRSCDEVRLAGGERTAARDSLHAPNMSTHYVVCGKKRQGRMSVMTTSPGLTSTLAPVHSSCRPLVSMLTRSWSVETTGLAGPAMITRRTPLNRG